jgi:hypothetical protein
MRTDRKPVIDHTREAEGFLFATHPLPIHDVRFRE